MLSASPLRLCALLASFQVLADGLQEKFASEGSTWFVHILNGIGLAPGAELTLEVVNSKPSNNTVLVVLSESQLAEWSSHPPHLLAGGGVSSYRISHSRYVLGDELQLRHSVCAQKPDRYFVGVVNARLETLQLHGRFSYVNPNGHHLPLQLVHLPAVNAIASIAFLCFVQAVVLLVATVWYRGATFIHGLLMLSAFLKAVELALKARIFQVLDEYGEIEHWRFVAWQLAYRLHDISMVSVILLIALGWRVLRARLAQPERRFLVLVLGLSTFIALQQACKGFLQGEDVADSFTLVFFVAKVSCYLVVIFAMNFNLQLLSLHLAEASAAPEVVVLYHKHQAYFNFRVVFLAIVFRPSVIIWLQLTVLNAHGTEWAVFALLEASDFMIYAGLLVTVQPVPGLRRVGQLLRSQRRSEPAVIPPEEGILLAADAEADDAQPTPSPAERRRSTGDRSSSRESQADVAAGIGSSDIQVPYMPLAGEPE